LQNIDKDRSIAEFNKAAKLRPDYIYAYLNIQHICRAAYDSKCMFEYHNRLVAKQPDFAPAYLELTWYHYRNLDIENSLKTFSKALALAPCDPQMLDNTPFSYSELSLHLGRLQKEIPQIADNPSFIKYTTLNSELPPDQSGNDDEMLYKMIRKDLLAAGNLARRHNVKLILSSYPQRSLPPVAEAARELAASYIDFVPLFKIRFQKPEEYLSFDRDHCNDTGYGFMAEKFADEILALEDADKK
ncbi:MAG TPA: hypothetical protein PLL10_00970, partial [Elusimicrobiales bacterium]|nr:hypothetical protein [Elusimicrobiales bacterium]